MKKIYLDYNIFVALADEERMAEQVNIDVQNKILQLINSNQYNFIYSPAHIEDADVPIIKKLLQRDKTGEQFTDDELNELRNRIIPRAGKNMEKIESITKNLFLCPTDNEATIITRSVFETSKNVTDKYYLNEEISTYQMNLMTSFKRNDNGQSRNISNYKLGFLKNNENGFGDKLVLKLREDDLLAQLMEHFKIDEIPTGKELKKHFHILERIFEISLDFLEEIRFKPEILQKSYSRMNDTSHANYASYADYFITDDARFFHKIKEIFNYYKIETVILNKQEFINFEFTT